MAEGLLLIYLGAIVVGHTAVGDPVKGSWGKRLSQAIWSNVQ